MAACPSCVKSVCQCHKDERTPKPDLITTGCLFKKGIHANVTIEIGEDCQVVSMKPATIEQINLCDPCELKPEVDTSAGNSYEAGYSDAKNTYYDIGYATGYDDGIEQGKSIGESEGYGKGYAEGVDNGYETGLNQGKLEVDCDARYNEGYNKGFDDAKAEQAQSAGDVLGGLSTKQAQLVEYINATGLSKQATIQQVDGVWVSDDKDISVNPKIGAIEINGSNIEANSKIIIKPTEIEEQKIKVEREPCPELPEPPIPSIEMKARILRPSRPSPVGGEFMASVTLDNAPNEAQVNWRLDYALSSGGRTFAVTQGVLSGTNKSTGSEAMISGRYPTLDLSEYKEGYMILYAEYVDTDDTIISTPYHLGEVSDNSKKFTL